MQYEAKSTKEYLESLENDWRKYKLEEVRSIIKLKEPDLEEGIEYNIKCYAILLKTKVYFI